MNQEVTASFTHLISDASYTSNSFFKEAKRTLDESGLKYSAADVVALASVAAYDFRTSVQAINTQKMRDAIIDLSGRLDGVALAIENISLTS